MSRHYDEVAFTDDVREVQVPLREQGLLRPAVSATPTPLTAGDGTGAGDALSEDERD